MEAELLKSSLSMEASQMVIFIPPGVEWGGGWKEREKDLVNFQSTFS